MENKKHTGLKTLCLTAFILLIINLVFGYYFYHAYSLNEKYKTHTIVAKAEIINEEKIISSGKKGSIVYYYIVSFKDSKGATETALIEKKATAFAPLHSTVDIVYDPADSKKVRFAEIAGDVDKSITLMGVMEGLVFIFSFIVFISQLISYRKFKTAH